MHSLVSVRTMTVVVAVLLAACADRGPGPGDTEEGREAAEERRGPYVQVLGTAQDGGLPHVACDCVRCEAARSDPGQRRHVASMAVILPESGKRYLIDASPDIRPQLDLLPRPGESDERVDRQPVDGVFLTHAHLGHYTGLAFFGYEAAHTRGVTVYCTRGMAAFLRNNAPWDQLVRLENILIREVEHGEAVDLGEGVVVTMVPVPHRKEYTDTVGYRIEGPRLSLFYVPDTDSWRDWDPPLPVVLENTDVAVLDGTFFSLDELPGRRVEEIGHPLIGNSMDLLEPTVREGNLRVYFTHMNHSNPALDPAGVAIGQIRERGFDLLEDGQEIDL